MSDDTRTILAQGSVYISNGWGQKVLEDQEGNVCILGALTKASEDLYGHRYKGTDGAWVIRNEPVFDARLRAAREIAKVIDDLPDADNVEYAVALWNDKPSRSKEDVILAFKRALEEV